MTVYNNLKIAILAIMTSQTVNAITIEPIQVQSGAGDLLYAEMKFSNANPNERVEAGLADPEDMMMVGVTSQPPGHLNFYTRRSSDGSGVIVITSSRPIVDAELNILLKIKEGNSAHIKQVKTPLTRHRTQPSIAQLNATANEKPLTPQVIVSEKDIALNLPTSTHYQVNTPTSTSTPSPTAPQVKSKEIVLGTPLAISTLAPPTLQVATEIARVVVPSPQAENKVQNTNNKVAETQQIEAIQAKDTAPVAETKVEKQNHDSAQANTEKSQSEVQKRKSAPVEKMQASQNNNQTRQHVVQANESLWKISSRIAAETNQSVSTVMKQIKEHNANAFIQGDVNRIRRGVALNLSASYNPTPKAKYQAPTTAVMSRKQSGSMKFRLDQAEMSLVADNEQNSAQGSAKKNTDANQTSTELSTKVMTSREKTVKLQKNVTQLATALQQKNQRIQLLNARLAQLQQQLEQQNVKKPTS